MVQKVVYNNCYGGFGLHNDVTRWARENKEQLREQYSDSDVDELVGAVLPGEKYDGGSKRDVDSTSNAIPRFGLSRDNELMADVVLGNTNYNGQINGKYSSLRVAEVPDGIEWTIDEYDGMETVKEKTQTFS